MITPSYSQVNSWDETRNNGSGVLKVIYSENSPFIFEDTQGSLQGIEYELLLDFRKFINDKYSANVSIQWEHMNSFESLYDKLKSSDEPILGIASLSIIDKRRDEINFSDPYLPDIEVIVSSGNLPKASNLKEFSRIIKGAQAIAVHNSTFEQNILDLKQDYFPGIYMHYVSDVDMLLAEISRNDDLWGYVSLPNYLTFYRKDKNINRQRFFVVENQGLAIGGTFASDWQIPLNEYLETERFQSTIDRLVNKHLGGTFQSVVWSISRQQDDQSAEAMASREVGVLTLERELQELQIHQDELKLKNQNLIIILEIVVLGIVLLALFVVYRMMRLKSLSNRKLNEKNEQIELQATHLQNAYEEIQRINSFIEQQNEELIALNKEKNDLIDIVVHDLKNPLTSAISVAELFREETNIATGHKEYLYLISKSLQRMRDLVGRILDIKLLDPEKLEFQMKKTDLKPIIQQVIDDMYVQSERKQIVIKHELCSGYAEVDEKLFRQIAENLVSNAIKFSHPNSDVRIESFQKGSFMVFQVADDGQGLTEEDQKKLFGKFQKLSASPTGGEVSTGLGLYIVKKYVDAMNGAISVRSEEGKGTKFSVKFRKAS